MKKIKGKRLGVKTLQAAEPPYSVSNGPIKILETSASGGGLKNRSSYLNFID